MFRRRVSCGVVLGVTLVLAACTPGRPGPVNPTAGTSRPAVGASASPRGTISGQALVFNGQPGYGTTSFPVPADETRFAYAHQSSCPDARLVPRHGLRLQARWRYQGGTADLSGVQASFNEESGSLALPFMTVAVTSAGPVRRWVTSAIEANRVKGYHSTGWVSLRPDYRAVPVESADPDLTLQLWAVDPLTNKLYCAAATGLFVVRGSAYGDSA
jgi:hypothetical protein